jgi:hypothetical protein
MNFFNHIYLFRWLKDSSRGMTPSTHSINWAFVRHFGGLKMTFFKGRKTLDSQVSNIHKASVRPIEGLTMRFFKVHETFGWRIQGFRCATFRHFGGLKSSNPDQLASCKPLLDILANWKCDSSKIYDNLRSRVSWFQLDTNKYYSDLNKRFHNRPVNFCSILRG